MGTENAETTQTFDIAGRKIVVPIAGLPPEVVRELEGAARDSKEAVRHTQRLQGELEATRAKTPPAQPAPERPLVEMDDAQRADFAEALMSDRAPEVLASFVQKLAERIVEPTRARADRLEMAHEFEQQVAEVAAANPDYAEHAETVRQLFLQYPELASLGPRSMQHVYTMAKGLKGQGQPSDLLALLKQQPDTIIRLMADPTIAKMADEARQSLLREKVRDAVVVPPVHDAGIAPRLEPVKPKDLREATSRAVERNRQHFPGG